MRTWWVSPPGAGAKTRSTQPTTGFPPLPAQGETLRGNDECHPTPFADRRALRRISGRAGAGCG